MIKKQAANSIVQFFSTLIVAMLLMVWGTMNIVINLMDMLQGAPGKNWNLGLVFAILFAVVPFVIGVVIAARLLRRQT